ncbi:hypothetical protein [Ectobacillus funiculus]|uniref:Secreted protein n=1 Tax=Ectobacillus funiculus TaxID=137993 RepID=A0ABV5WH20_9BACI
MKKWLISAIVYLLIVIGGYAAWKSISGEDAASEQGEHSQQHAATAADEHAHEGHDDPQQQVSEVKSTVEYKDGTLYIGLTDSANQPVNDLEINHEKLMHFIIVSEDLQQYYHVHPTKAGDGKFEVALPLQEGTYKAFIDIKPKDLNYQVEPVVVQVGDAAEHHHETALTPETQFTKTIAGKILTMEPDSFKAGEPITLSFSFADGTVPEPYLGALGHVVILDEHGETYVHVHPASQTDTKFETTFAKPGVYKIWAEFQFQGKVITYPFTVKVES